MTRFRSVALVVLTVLLAACSSPQSPQERAEAQERAQLNDTYKARYPDVVMGFDFHGPSVDVSIDLQALISMDEDKEDTLKSDAIRAWRNAWTAAHPHEHALLTARIVDFKGNEEFRSTAHV